MGRESEPSAPKRSVGTVPVTWPADERARERMAAYLAELKDCAAIDDAFLETLESRRAEDERVPAVLAEKARERFTVLGNDEDAIERTLRIVDWTWNWVAPTVYPDLSVIPVRSIDDAQQVMVESAALAEEAQEAWRAAYNARGESGAHVEWARYQVIDGVRSAAKSLRYCERRMSVAKFKGKEQTSDHPLLHLQRSVADCADALTYATQLSPEAAWALDRLGASPEDLAQDGVRARTALRAAGVTGFGPKLNSFALAVLTISEHTDTAARALDAAHRAVPTDPHEALVAVCESPQMSARALPTGAATLQDAAHEMLWQLADELVAQLRE